MVQFLYVLILSLFSLSNSAPTLFLTATSNSPVLTISEENIEAIHSEDLAVVHLPIENKSSNTLIASASLKILDFSDSILGETQKTIIIEQGPNIHILYIPIRIDLKTLITQRLAYTIRTKSETIEGLVSLSRIVELSETHVIGPKECYANARVNYRIVTRKLKDKEPITGAIVTGFLANNGDTIWMSDGISDTHGNTDLSFFAPDSPGDYKLIIKVHSPYDEDEIIEHVRVKKENQIYLISDKPIYQPGQIIYIRALALSRFHSKPVINETAKIQISDARNNRVFRYATKTDSFGVFSTDFKLADEVNHGTYTIEALVSKGRQTKTIEVKPYVLPKFKIDFTTDKQYYKPGNTVKGALHAEYFFGKKVSNAEVLIKLFKYEVGWNEFTKIKGKTDREGSFEFSVRMPKHFVGQPFEQGHARVRFDISIIDGAMHEEKVSKSVVITKDDIIITVISESEQLMPHLANTLFIITTSPDGLPVRTELRVSAKKGSADRMRLSTDKLGLTEISATPDKNGELDLIIDAYDITGQRTRNYYKAKGTEVEHFTKVISSKAMYRVGDVIDLTILSSVNKGPVFIDVIRQRQTIGSYVDDIADGRAEVEIPLSADYNGLIQFNAYVVLPTGQIVRDVHTIFVDPAEDLEISVLPNKSSYLPGDEASVDFLITGKNRKPVVACLGISAVDEAVFALSEMQPGLEKVYFMLEREIFAPRFEIHGFEPVNIVKFESEKYNYNMEDIEAKERAGRVLLSGISQLYSHQFEKNTGLEKLPIKNRLGEARGRVYTDVANIAQKLFDYHNERKPIARDKDIEEAFASMDQSIFTDPWGNPYEKAIIKEKTDWYLEIKSAGPDEKSKTDDDIESHRVSFLTRVYVDYGKYGPVIIVNDEPSEYGKISGRVIDSETGEPLVGADVIVQGTELGTSTNEKGEYTIRHIPEGTYSIICSYISYDPFIYTNVAVLTGKRTILAFWLRPTVIEVRAVTVSAERPVIVTSQTDTRRAVAKEKLDRLAVTAVSTPREEPKVRKYFPETFLFEPSIITDNKGKASLRFLLPDNITTWRMSMTGSAKDGRLGSNTMPLQVFKDFFIDLDLPVSLTSNDEISLPVAVYNYLKERINVRVEIAQEDWFQLIDETSKDIAIEEEDVGVVYFRIKALEFGQHKILVKAFANGSSDAIQKKVKVVPNGKREQSIISGRLKKDTEFEVEFPPGTIPGSQRLLIRLYPGILSQIVDGLEGLLRMPFGCFEQTTSITYPNVLILDYLRTSEKRTPEIEMKALEYISIGYQRLVSYEVLDGGFSWWGDAPANKLLTAYGLMQFHDMMGVFEIDERIIERTIRWLTNQQENDGSWSVDPFYHHREVWGKFKNAEILPTALITWALLEAEHKGDEIDKAIDFITNNLSGIEDPYALALVANALVLHDSKSGYLDMVFSKLFAGKIEEGDRVYWSSSISSITNSRGKGANIETSSLIALALIRSRRYTEVARKAINFLNASRHPNGGWRTTQGTVYALKAILESARGLGEETSATVGIVLNGERMSKIDITPETSDIVRMIDIKEEVEITQNTLRLEMRGKGALLYDVVSDYYRSWGDVSIPPRPLLAITQKYDKTRLIKNDIVSNQISIANNSNMNLQMVIVDLGIPPGFDVIETDLADLVSKKTIQKYNLTPRQIIIYFETIGAQKTCDFSYQLKAKFPLRAQSGHSRVYDYYNPDVVGIAKPVEIEVGD